MQAQFTPDGRLVQLETGAGYFQTDDGMEITGIVVGAVPCDVRWDWEYELTPWWDEEDPDYEPPPLPDFVVTAGMLTVRASWNAMYGGDITITAHAYSIETGEPLGSLSLVIYPGA